ncbi:MAG: hypothetical protein IJ213_08795 [Bacteroidales bacterium]|nr:hypothetical protein [Bacteroidales bacterium]
MRIALFPPDGVWLFLLNYSIILLPIKLSVRIAYLPADATLQKNFGT